MKIQVRLKRNTIDGPIQSEQFKYNPTETVKM